MFLITNKIGTVNVRVPKEIVEWMDTLIDDGGYKSRGEVIRDFLRDHVKTETKYYDRGK